ncbi:MAG: hypothetical protein LHW51_07840 [Candidatus Cloacimonetes bacterium]|nr:hypothetical protein [Candidatus Cloacimonadota bacterium]MCB5269255.1 hypothetical protein [Candidatus Cloacimonadota bacterium]
MSKHYKLIILIAVILLLTLPMIFKKKPAAGSKKNVEVEQRVALISSALLVNNEKVEEATMAWLNMPNRRRDVIDPGLTLIPNLADHLYMKHENDLLSDLSQGSMIYILRTHLDSLAQYAGIEKQAEAEEGVSNEQKVSETRENLIEIINRLVSEPDPVTIQVINNSQEAMIDQAGQVVDPGQTEVFLREDRRIGDHYEGAFKIDSHAFPYNPEENSIRIPTGYDWQKIGSNRYQLRKKQG